MSDITAIIFAFSAILGFSISCAIFCAYVDVNKKKWIKEITTPRKNRR